ncbi:HpcH/HpaI aldolase family protein [Bordetella genomosp. 5]|nr:aldolase/citrate lyase family protein [Bordetella genomosp. 5]
MSVKLVPSPDVARIAAHAGVDALYVDLEHGLIDPFVCGQICLAAFDAGITPLVRIPAGDLSLAARLLDNGAMGIIVPHVETAEDVRRAVRACRYPPLGQRGSVNRLPHWGYSTFPADRLQAWLESRTLLVAMIESLDAIDRLDEIAAEPGLDLIWIGMNDLSSSAGVPGDYDHASIIKAVTRIRKVCAKYGRKWGVAGLGDNAGLYQRYIDNGAQFVSLGSDALLLGRAVRAAVLRMADTVNGP